MASQIIYLAAGTMGLPVFAGGTAGPAVLFGPTGGYLLSFPAAAFAAGWIRERSVPSAQLCWFTASFVALALVYLSGASWLSVWLRATGTQTAASALTKAWQLGVAPFLIGDVAKVLVATAVAQGNFYILGRLFRTHNAGREKGAK
jgi:biotin transport system substrate-specific component